MVFYFMSKVVSTPFAIYMGKDKHENEDLIKYGFPEDIWFHVDKLSSAHVYLRLPKDQTMDDIPPEVLTDCTQLVKANSIQGNKMNNVAIVYTPWANLKKTGDMAVGQVSFYNQKEVRTIIVEKRQNDVINRLNKTKQERTADLASEKEARNLEEIAERKVQAQEERRRMKEEEKKSKEMEALRNYSSLMDPGCMSSNQDGNDSDEFM
uniref:Coiled-coil domain-containing protein 25 n=1 Tax=Eptatretus burgeri TaxID=7764 RepID=A0A8C4Q3X6_EPTBU